MYPVALVMLQEDELLSKMRFALVPKLVKEEVFWRNYFYRVSLIKQSAQLTALAAQQQAAGKEDKSNGREQDLPLTGTFRVEDSTLQKTLFLETQMSLTFYTYQKCHCLREKFFSSWRKSSFFSYCLLSDPSQSCLPQAFLYFAYLLSHSLFLFLFFFFRHGSHYVAQAVLKLLDSSDPPASASQVAGTYRHEPLCLGSFFSFFSSLKHPSSSPPLIFGP
uniref:BSD domain-containing protein n=1 Tax=Piliocolobus tephrosceles TaxID=591936 RepID=A0A8C9GWW6_9PRIM